jgi:hypothetical protein
MHVFPGIKHLAFPLKTIDPGQQGRIGDPSYVPLEKSGDECEASNGMASVLLWDWSNYEGRIRARRRTVSAASLHITHPVLPLSHQAS